jgi:hypothetical protein
MGRYPNGLKAIQKQGPSNETQEAEVVSGVDVGQKQLNADEIKSIVEFFRTLLRWDNERHP